MKTSFFFNLTVNRSTIIPPIKEKVNHLAGRPLLKSIAPPFLKKKRRAPCRALKKTKTEAGAFSQHGLEVAGEHAGCQVTRRTFLIDGFYLLVLSFIFFFLLSRCHILVTTA